jgi:hypothetical protein
VRKICFYTLFSFLALSSCGLTGNVVTMDSFANIDLCTSIEQVKMSLGEPFAIVEMENGFIEYEYIERISIGSRNAEERHYYILIKDGYVVSKRIKQSSVSPIGPLPLGFDSYEMQTTYKELAD